MSNATRQRVRHAPSPKKKGINWVWVTIIGVVVVLGVGAIYMSGGGKEAGTEIGDSVTVSGEPLTANRGARRQSAHGHWHQPRRRRSRGFSPGQGTPMIIFGVAHWCPHCQAEIPRLVKYEKEGMFKGIDIVAISTAQDEARGNWPPSVWLDKEGWDGVVLADDKNTTAFNAYGLSGFPAIIAIDAQGNVVALTSGEKTEAEMQSIVNAAKTGTKDANTTPGASSNS